MKYIINVIFVLLSFICLSEQYPVLVNTNISVIVSHKNYYSIGYSDKYKQALWCQYILTSNELASAVKITRTDDFRMDKSLPVKSSKPSDYNNSGFDKGHLCPAQDRAFSTNATSETFLMSNMSPQEPSFNRGIWKALEDKTRKYASKKESVTVITGPILLNRYMNITNNIAIPHMYYKIIFDNCNTNKCIGFVIPNQLSKFDVKTYCVPICFIESLTSLKFNFCDPIYKNYINYYILESFK